jgi:hypothetical protein
MCVCKFHDGISKGAGDGGEERRWRFRDGERRKVERSGAEREGERERDLQSNGGRMIGLQRTK